MNDGTHSYAFDAENRLTAVDNGTTASYIYNAEGERVHENVGGVVEEFLNASGPQDLTIVDASQNSIETDYSFGGRPFATANSGGLYFAATDNLGTVRARLNASGASVETDTSWPYGEFRNYANAISRLHFTGKLDDTESGLDYFGARYYNADLGRFLTPDWSSEPEAIPYADLIDPQTLDLYNFVRNSPVTATDPDGHWCIFGVGTTCTKVPASKLPVKEGGAAVAGADGDFVESVLSGLTAEATAVTLGGAAVIASTVFSSGSTDRAGDVEAFYEKRNEPAGEKDKDKEAKKAATQPASEQTAKDMADQIERDLGKNARRDFHDLKGSGSQDRTLDELKEDANRVYKDYGKIPPRWMQPGGGE